MKQFLLGLAFLIASVQALDWAVVVAGSNTWSNYRHQADVCHSYQVVHKNGIPDSRVIMMQYDDLANNTANPFPGQVFNAPSPQTPGTDVYGGTKKDYTGLNVTAAMFIAVLTGDSVASGGNKVLQSGPDDHVFVYFADHGGTGIVAFPTGPYLTVAELQAALQTMVDKKMFAQLTFYMEACEAGSMFEGMPTNENIYVTTAANAVESSYGTYCPPQDFVNGKSMETCLGDLYSVNFLQDCDIPGQMNETLQAQYTKVKAETTMSHVMQYGDLSFTAENIGQFFGDTSPTPEAPVAAAVPQHESYTTHHKDVQQIIKERSAIRSRDIPMHLAYYKYLRAFESSVEKRMELLEELQAELSSRAKSDLLFLNLAKEFGGEHLFYNPAQRGLGACGECCDKSYEAYRTMCGGFDDYSFQYSRVITNICRAGVPSTTLVEALRQKC
jgi:legumain